MALAIGEFFNRTKGLSRYPFSLVVPDALSGEPKKFGAEEEGVLPPMAFERAKLEERPVAALLHRPPIGAEH